MVPRRYRKRGSASGRARRLLAEGGRLVTQPPTHCKPSRRGKTGLSLQRGKAARDGRFPGRRGLLPWGLRSPGEVASAMSSHTRSGPAPAGLSCRFTRAVVRRPAASIARGLRAEERGDPDLELFERQHASYRRALEQAGLAVAELPPLEAFPDSVFVEDAALCLPGLAVALRPGAPSRRGEAAALLPELERRFGEVVELAESVSVDGGDVLTTDREILVGLSARTDAAGAEALAAALAPHGHRVRRVDTPAGVLHLKSDCATLGGDEVLATPRLAASGCFAGYRVIETAAGEEAAANAVRVNDRVLLAAGFPRTAERLERAGYRLVLLELSEAAKLDGGLSCLSLRFAE